FFSSRRRHTRFSRDWSSDVCSSDLLPAGKCMTKFVQQHNTKQGQIFECCPDWIVIPLREPCHFKRSDNEPGEVQIDAYSGQTKRSEERRVGKEGRTRKTGESGMEGE